MKNAVMLATVHTHTHTHRYDLINKNVSTNNALFVLYKKDR